MDSSTPKFGERRSSRAKKRRESYSPELKTESKVRKQNQNTKQKSQSRTNPNRLYDVMPNGEAFCCHMCKSPYVAASHKTGKKTERSRHTPLPNNRINKMTGRKMVLCNACAVTFDGPHLRVRKPVILPTEEDQEKYLQEAREFTQSIQQHYDDLRVERLFCPVSRKKLCGCLQKYIKSKGVDGTDSPVPELLALMKEAEDLRKEKAYTIEDNTKSKKFIGLGNGHKKSRRYEEFVLLKRSKLKEDMGLCERATQRILIYSNNFLHKRLKTENRPCRIQRTRGRAALGKLPDLHTFVELTCCSDNCVMLALTHRKLLQEWRERAQQGQMEARRVLAEMLTPAGASHCNCYQFISMVTGCSPATISRVCNQMIDTYGTREPPEHGMKKVWQEMYKKGRMTATQTETAAETGNQTVPLASQDMSSQQEMTSQQEATSQQTATNNLTAPAASYEMQQQRLSLIQQEISQKQKQLHEQEVNLQLLAQQVSSGESWQNIGIVQQLLKQLAGHNNNSAASTAETAQLQHQTGSNKATLVRTSDTENKTMLVSSQAQVLFSQDQQQQVTIVSPANIQWNQSIQEGANQAHIPVPVKLSQHIVSQSDFPASLNQSHFPTLLNQNQVPLPTNQVQVPLGYNQLTFQEASNFTPMILPLNQLNVILPHTGPIMPSGQTSGQKPQLNVQNVLLDSLNMMQQDVQKNVQLSLSSPDHVQQIDTQPSEPQSVEVQLIPCSTQNLSQYSTGIQLNVVDNNQVPRQETETIPVYLNQETIQQLINNGSLEVIPPGVSTAHAGVEKQKGHEQNNGHSSEASENLTLSESMENSNMTIVRSEAIPQVVSDQSHVISVPSMNKDQPVTQVSSITRNSAGNKNTTPHPNKSRLARKDSSKQQSATETKQSLSFDCPNTVLSRLEILKHLKSKNKKRIGPEESETATHGGHTSTESVEELTENQPQTNTQRLISVNTNAMAGSMISGHQTKTGEFRTYPQTQSTTSVPSQIQISFETVVDQSGHTATSHVILPHTNVVTLPFVPLYADATSQMEASEQTNEVSSREREILVENSVVMKKMNDQAFLKKDHEPRIEKLKSKQKNTKKLKEKIAKEGTSVDTSGKMVEGEFRQDLSSIQGKKESFEESKHERHKLLFSRHPFDVAESTKQQDMYSDRSRHSSGNFDKSRHSSGSSVRSRQSSGNSDSLRQVLSFDSLRPLSGMSDLLERSRQHSGNSQANIRSRTSSGNSYLSEQIHSSILSNISPSLLNKEKVFFMPPESEMVVASSLNISEPVHQNLDFMIEDEHLSEIETFTVH